MPLPAGQLKERRSYRYGFFSEMLGSVATQSGLFGRVVAFRLFSTPIVEEQSSMQFASELHKPWPRRNR